ncbi:MAG: hypothetical protein KY475_05210, partial [Planctomycetes bacterium]|nr:hypothetical protein [Planctomycetota bacterium]
ITPLMALLIRRTMYWQISAIGIRYVNVFRLTTLTWDQIECVRHMRPFPLYFAGRIKRAFVPKEIMLAPWLMEGFSEFQRLVARHAPDGHILVDFALRPGDYEVDGDR